MKEKTTGNKRADPLVLNLNTASAYSFLSSVLSIADIIAYASQHQRKYVAICDVNLHAAADFCQQAMAHNLIPIVGLKVNYEQHVFSVFAKNYAGYLNLVQISSLQNLNQTVPFAQLLQDVFIVQETNQPFPFQTICSVFHLHNPNQTIPFHKVCYADEQSTKAYNCMQFVKNSALEISSEQQLATEHGYVFYDVQQTQAKYDDAAINRLNAEIKTIQPWSIYEQATTDYLAFSFLQAEQLTPIELLQKYCLTGLKAKIKAGKIVDLHEKIYQKRLAYELSVIGKMGFANYFLVVRELVNIATANKIMLGPGRGSAAGCLVAYLLNITQVDPLQYGLLFERFLNEGRISKPDIDIDVVDSERKKLLTKIIVKFGQQHFAQIATFTTIKAKLAIRDVARIYKKIALANDPDFDGYGFEQNINAICKLIKVDTKQEFANAIAKDKGWATFFNNAAFGVGEDNLFYKIVHLACHLIGLPRQLSVHAGGVVLAFVPLHQIIPVTQSNDGEVMGLVTQFSMEHLESLGLIKIDLLALTNLTSIQNTIKLVYLRHKIQLDLQKLDLQAPGVFADLTAGYTAGVFQLESQGMTKVVQKVQPTVVNDIAVCIALYRPGPMQHIDTYVARRNGKEKINYIDPKNANLLKSTYGILVFQEQVINLVKNITNCSLAEADDFRRIIAKKDEAKIATFEQTFYQKGMQNGYSENDLQTIYKYIVTFANYGFNHSHAIGYALIAYWTAYLKHFYPLEYMSALFYSGATSDKLQAYLQECLRLQIEIVKPHINLSQATHVLAANQIVFGFSTIKGIGKEKGKKLVAIRNQMPNQQFPDFVQAIYCLHTHGFETSLLEKLVYAGAFDCFANNKKYMLAVLKLITENKKKDHKVLSQNINMQLYTGTNSAKSGFALLWEQFYESNQTALQKCWQTYQNSSLTPNEVKTFAQKEKELLGFEIKRKNTIPARS